jgi:AcrR family transcriptional regulator
VGDSGDSGDPAHARARILEVARAEIARAGWAAATSGRVARSAGVSKALVHYYFRDRASLGVAVATHCEDSIVTRAAEPNRNPAHENPVDEFGDWLQMELASGDMRVALLVKLSGNPAVKRAAERALAAFRAELQRQIDQVFAKLGVRPTVPRELVGDLFAATTQGMGIGWVEWTTRQRQTLETLWLSLLTLAE